jgi:hypothetical protein
MVRRVGQDAELLRVFATRLNPDDRVLDAGCGGAEECQREQPVERDPAWVRKQYHFWPGVDGLDAWDVDRLVELSRGPPVRELDLASIGEIDSVYWFDDRRESPTVRRVVDHARMIEQADLSYPIILGHDGRVMDGMHRIAKAVLLHQRNILAVQFDEPLEPDYRNCRPEDLPY